MSELIRVALSIAGKDLRIELRTREILVATGMFAILVVVLTSIAFYLDPIMAKRVAPGVIWITIAFSGVLAMTRTWAKERDGEALSALIMSPAKPAAIFLGKCMSTLVFLGVVEVVIVTLVGIFFHVDIWDVLGPLVLLLSLGSIGFVAAGTVFAAMSVRTQARDVMVSVALFPLIAPMLMGGVVGTRNLFEGASLDEVMSWVRMLGAGALTFSVLGAALFGMLVDD